MPSDLPTGAPAATAPAPAPTACTWREGASPRDCRFRNLTDFFTSTLELDELIQAAAAFVHGLVRAERVRLWLLRRGGQRLIAREFDPGAPDGVSELMLPADEGTVGRTATERRTFVLGPGTTAGPGGEFRSALLVPLLRRGACLGVIECLDKAGADGFGDDDRAALESVSEDLAVAIENAQLYYDTRRKSLERAVLLEVGRALALPLDLTQTLEAIMDQLRRIVHYDAAAIYLLDRETGQIVSEASCGYPPEFHEATASRSARASSAGWRRPASRSASPTRDRTRATWWPGRRPARSWPARSSRRAASSACSTWRTTSSTRTTRGTSSS
jgi:GAF domain-containing protein